MWDHQVDQFQERISSWNLYRLQVSAWINSYQKKNFKKNSKVDVWCLLYTLYKENEEGYTESLYDGVGWTGEVKTFPSFNIINPHKGLGPSLSELSRWHSLFKLSWTESQPYLNHDFFSQVGNDLPSRWSKPCRMTIITTVYKKKKNLSIRKVFVQIFIFKEWSLGLVKSVKIKLKYSYKNIIDIIYSRNTFK